MVKLFFATPFGVRGSRKKKKEKKFALKHYFVGAHRIVNCERIVHRIKANNFLFSFTFNMIDYSVNLFRFSIRGRMFSISTNSFRRCLSIQRQLDVFLSPFMYPVCLAHIIPRYTLYLNHRHRRSYLALVLLINYVK